MIRELLDKLTGRRKSRFGKRVEIGPATHRIDLSLVDGRAISVVSTLKNAGYEAYIVGGAVRDLLLGLRPKDFDVATNATPEQVKALFRRAFIIGRRFRIVHVVFGRGREHEVIEVSTFRAHLDSADAEHVSGNERTAKSQLAGVKHAVDASGRVLRDNVWGPQHEDAARRDFSINAMYYDPQSQIVVDYHNGFADAQKRVLRMIGDAAARYREDPVRIIRATRFAAKLAHLGFRLDAKTSRPLAALKGLLADVPQSRLFDEMLKLLQTGHGQASVEQLKKLGLAQGIYPLLDLAVQRAQEPFMAAALQDTDRRVAEGKPVAPSFLLACLLWQDVRALWQQRTAQGEHAHPALQAAIDEVFDARIGDVSGRGRLAADMREIWMMQPRFEKRTGASCHTLAEQPRFRAGLDFLQLRAANGEVPEMLADWWTQFAQSGQGVREDLIAQARAEQQRAPRSKARKPKAAAPAASLASPADSASPGPAAAGEAALPQAASADGAAPAKKRRRRRKPAGGAPETASAPAAHAPSRQPPAAE